MEKARFPALMLIVGVAGITGLAAWDAYQVEHATFQEQQRWVHRVSDRVVADRQEFANWLDRFPADDPRLLTKIPESNSAVAALYLANMDAHTMKRWVHPSVHDQLQALGPRLGVLELTALTEKKTQLGPVLFIRGAPHA